MSCVCVCVCLCEGSCVCVCVCTLAFKGALLLAHVSMCVCVHLVWWRLVRCRMNALRVTSDLLQCCRVAAQECLNVKVRSVSPSPLLCLQYCYWTEWLLVWDREHTFWLRVGCDGCVSSLSTRTATWEAAVAGDGVQLFWRKLTLIGARSLVHLAKKTKQWSVEGRKKNTKTSWMCHLAAIFSVVVTTHDNSRLNSLHGSCL